MMHRLNMFGGRLHQREGGKTESIVLRSCLLGILIRERAHTGATQPRSTRFGTTNHFVTLFVHLFSRIHVQLRPYSTRAPPLPSLAVVRPGRIRLRAVGVGGTGDVRHSRGTVVTPRERAKGREHAYFFHISYSPAPKVQSAPVGDIQSGLV